MPNGKKPEKMEGSMKMDKEMYCGGGGGGDSRCSSGSYCGPHYWGRGDFGRKIMLTLAGVLLVYLIFYVGTLMRNNMKKYDYIGQADQMERTITVTGFGKVTGSNDIAVTTLGYANVDKDVARAQTENKKVMDAILKDLRGLGIADKDVQSDYSIHPEYNYTPDKGQQLIGYRVSNNATVKIRDLKKISDVLGLVGRYGATNVSGLSFTIDDPENLKQQARDKALQDALVKAARLAQSLGVRLVGVVSYTEFESGDFPLAPVYGREIGLGMGGGGPDVAPGSKDLMMNVNITYKIVPR